jgi:RNA-directed DNA polymerase
MQESYGEGVATRTGPESCAIARKDEGEALTGVRAGRVLSCETNAPSRKRRVLRGADVVVMNGRPHLACRYREMCQDPARSETPSMHGNIPHGSREIPRLSTVEGIGDRIGKSKDVRR